MKDQPTCSTCSFYHDDGHCRRFPPNQPGDKWPSMDGNRWCGEHKPVETLAPAHKITMKDQTYTIEEVSKLVAQIAKLEVEMQEARNLARYYQEQLGHANQEHEWQELPWEERSGS